MPAKKLLIVLAGPTAVGKTSLSISLARHYACPVLSADSRQFYREMNIGTAKITADEQQGIPHFFINSLSIHQAYSVGEYERDALQSLEDIYQNHDKAILAGGSGLYIQAVCEGLDEFPEVPENIQQDLEKLFANEGIGALQAELKKRDPLYFEQVDQQNPRRLLRALAVCRASGRAFSDFRRQQTVARAFHPVYFLLEMEREQLYNRINQKVDSMMEQGLLEEARQLFPHRQQKALQTVGYQELFRYLEGSASLEEAVDLIKRNSRRYAKRQMTWFRKGDHWQRFAPHDLEAIIACIDQQ